MTTQEFISIINKQRLPANNEKQTQLQIEQILITKEIPYLREVALDPNNIIDFMVLGNVGIEIKLKAQQKPIYKQLLRYCQFDQVNEIILICNKALHLPPMINNKKAHLIQLGKAWL